MVLREIGNQEPDTAEGVELEEIINIDRDVTTSVAATQSGSLVAIDGSQSMVVTDTNGSIIQANQPEDIGEPTSVSSDPESDSVWTVTTSVGSPKPPIDRGHDSDFSPYPANRQVNKVTKSGSGDVDNFVAGRNTRYNGLTQNDDGSILGVRNNDFVRHLTADMGSRVARFRNTSVMDPSSNDPDLTAVEEFNADGQNGCLIVASSRYDERAFKMAGFGSSVGDEFNKFKRIDSRKRAYDTNQSGCLYYIGRGTDNNNYLKKSDPCVITELRTSASNTNTFSSSNFSDVRGITYANDTIWVADNNRDRLYKFDADDGSGIEQSASLARRPIGIETDAFNNVFTLQRHEGPSAIKKHNITDNMSVISSFATFSRDERDIALGPSSTRAGIESSATVVSPSINYLDIKFNKDAENLAIGNSDCLYISPNNNSRSITKVDQAGSTESTIMSSNESARDIALDSQNSIIVGSSSGIRKYSNDGNNISSFIENQDTLTVAVDTNDSIFVTQQNDPNFGITVDKKLDANGNELDKSRRVFRNARTTAIDSNNSIWYSCDSIIYESGESLIFGDTDNLADIRSFNRQDISIDSNSSIWLADDNQDAAVQLDQSGNVIQSFTTSESNIRSIDTLSSDSLLIGYNNSTMLKTDQTGSISNLFELQRNISQTAVDSQDSLFIVENNNTLSKGEPDIRKFDLNGVPLDDIAISSFVADPRALAIDNQDSLHVFESDNHEGMYKFDLSGDTLLDYTKTHYIRNVTIDTSGSYYMARDSVISRTDQSDPYHDLYFNPAGGADTRQGIAFDSSDTQWINGYLNDGITAQYNIDDGLDVMPFPKNVMRNTSRPVLDYDRVNSTYIRTQRNSDVGSLVEFTDQSSIANFGFSIIRITEPVGHDVRGFTVQDDASGSYWYYTSNRKKLLKTTRDEPLENRVKLDNSGDQNDIRGLVVTDDECIYTTRNRSTIVKHDFNGNIENTFDIRELSNGGVSIMALTDLDEDGFLISDNSGNMTYPVDSSFTQQKIVSAPDSIPTFRQIEAATKSYDGCLWTVGSNSDKTDRYRRTPSGNGGRQRVLARTSETLDEQVLVDDPPFNPQNVEVGGRTTNGGHRFGIANSLSENNQILYARNSGDNNIRTGNLRLKSLNRNGIFSAPSNQVRGIDRTANGSVWYYESRNNVLRRTDTNGSSDVDITPKDVSGSTVDIESLSVDESDNTQKVYTLTDSSAVIKYNNNGSIIDQFQIEYGNGTIVSTQDGFIIRSNISNSDVNQGINSSNIGVLVRYSDNGIKTSVNQIGDKDDEESIASMVSPNNDITHHPISDSKIVTSGSKIISLGVDGEIARRYNQYSPRKYHELYGHDPSVFDNRGIPGAKLVVDVTNIQSEPKKCIALHMDGKVRKHTKSGPTETLLSNATNFVSISHRNGILYLMTPTGSIYKYTL